MKILSSSLFITLILFLSGCKSLEVDVLYKDCIINTTQKKIVDGHGEKKDIFRLLEEVELLLIKDKIIQDSSKESYLKLTEIIFNDKQIANRLKTSIKSKVNNNLFDYLSLTSLDFFDHCPSIVFEKMKDDNEKMKLKKRYTLYASLTAEGYQNKNTIINLIDDEKNLSKTQRLVVLHLLLLNL